MARNEEKQLARLNRFYLQKDKEAQLKKNPRRPRLETLNTSAEIQKWLPSIKQDLNFYIQQSEVTCYTQSKIDEFSRKINGLKWEYRAFVKKLRQLNPALEVTPWTDRPYAGHKRKAEAERSEETLEHAVDVKQDVKTCDLETSNSPPTDSPVDNSGSVLPRDKPAELNETCTTTDNSCLIQDCLSSQVEGYIISVVPFIPLSTPVLENDTCYTAMYGYDKPAPVVLNANKLLEDAPLEFSSRNLRTEDNSHCRDKPCTNVSTGCVNVMYGYNKPAPVVLNANKLLEDAPLEFSNSRNLRTEDNSHNGDTSDKVSPGCANVILKDSLCVENEGVERSLETNIQITRTCQTLCQSGINSSVWSSKGSLVCSSSNINKINEDYVSNVTSSSSDRAADQYSGSVEANQSSPTSFNQTHCATDITNVSPCKRNSEKHSCKVPSLLVVPYSDSESETET